ncbi:MAG: hypothetical protein KA144_08845, partial [Xanthomonadaceae bacterium]|nr:hypothetical protein [Xanthomonadaceae bacterium]
WSIEARSLSIVGGVAAHNFWVLRDDKGKAVAELHGLATDRDTGKTVPIGTDADQHSLRVKHFIHDEQYARNFGSKSTNATYIQEGQRSETVSSGSREEILGRWKVGATTAAKLINQQDLDYPPGGFKLDGSTKNSNSVYNTVGAMMVGGSNVPVFHGPLQPGVNNHVLDFNTRHLLQYDRPQFRQGQNLGGDIQVATVDPNATQPQSARDRMQTAAPSSDMVSLISGNDRFNRQFEQALKGTNGDRDAAALAVSAIRDAGGKPDQDISVSQGKNGLIVSQGQGDAALNVPVPSAKPGDFERVAAQIAQQPQPTPQVAMQPEPQERKVPTV